MDKCNPVYFNIWSYSLIFQIQNLIKNEQKHIRDENYFLNNNKELRCQMWYVSSVCIYCPYNYAQKFYDCKD